MTKGILKLREDGILDPTGKYKNPFTKESYTDAYKKYAIEYADGRNKGWTDYITWKDRNEIFTKIHKNQVLLIIAPTGVGKTVIVPKLLLHYFDYKTPVICTTPRQKTTRLAAEYASRLMDVPIVVVDEITKKITWTREKDFYVGYKYGDMRSPKSDKATKLLFSTDGTIKVIITKNDPLLSQYAGIIIDEAHERSVDIDILLGLVVDICRVRPNFKVIIMSATVSERVFTNYFSLMGFGDKFAIYQPKEPKTNYEIRDMFSDIDIPAKQVQKKLQMDIDTLLKNTQEMDKLLGPGNVDSQGNKYKKYGRDILAFIASGTEGLAVKRFLDAQYKKGAYKHKPYVMIFTRDSEGLDLQIATEADGLNQANMAEDSPGDYEFKIILSTPVSESSMTFNEPLAYVFDSGKNFFSHYRPLFYGTYSYKDYVTRANIKQRCGRTGRNNNGICLHSYSKNQYDNVFLPFPDPEVITSDITDDLLGICLLPNMRSMHNCMGFLKKLIEPIANYKDNVTVAFRNLLEYDCIDSAGVLTGYAKICSSFGKYNYNIVRLLCMGYYAGVLVETIYLAGILSNIKQFSDLFSKPPGMEDDPELLAKFKSVLAKFAHPSGEHLSLLNLYMEWVKIPDKKKREWEKGNGIHGGKLKRIKVNIEGIAKAVVKNLKDIRELNLIKIYPEKPPVVQKPKPAPKPAYKPKYGGASIASRSIFTNGELVAKPGCADEYNEMVSFKEKLHMCRGGMVGGGSGTVQEKLKTFIDSDDFSMSGLFKHTKTGGAVDLGPIHSWPIDDRILLSIYFAYCTHLAVAEGGNSLNYVVRYSPVVASIKNSVLADVMNIRPNFIVYHNYNINEEQGNKLEVASYLPQRIINTFMTAKTTKLK